MLYIPFPRCSISTHSLTKRLTVPATENDFYGYISTHSLTKRLTSNLAWILGEMKYFNSQPHEEADICLFVLRDFNSISTHSLTKRLTHHTPMQ